MIRTLARFIGLSLGLIFSFGVIADRVIVLKDGSRIRGEIISVENGLYRIESDSMGTILLGGNQIQSILSGEESGYQPAEGSLSAEGSLPQMQSIQSTIMSNPGIMSSILALQNDPQMQAVLADPEVMKAIQSFDLEALARNPRIKALMNNPSVKRIQGEMQ